MVQLVVKAWKANDKLVLLGAGGIMARVSNNTELDREELSSNHEILAPIIQHMGSLAKDMINLTNCFCEISCYNYRVKNHLHILRLETIYRSAWSKCGSFSYITAGLVERNYLQVTSPQVSNCHYDRPQVISQISPSIRVLWGALLRSCGSCRSMDIAEIGLPVQQNS